MKNIPTSQQIELLFVHKLAIVATAATSDLEAFPAQQQMSFCKLLRSGHELASVQM